jgi:exosortase O
MINSDLVRSSAQPDGHRWQAIIGAGAIILSWFYLNHAALQWFAQTLQDISWFNLLLLAAGALFLLFLGVRQRQDLQFAVVPTLRRGPLALLLGSGVAAMASRWLLSLPQLPAVFMILGTYGLLGLFLAPKFWRKGLPIGLAIAVLLPFGVQFSSGLGSPAKVLTASLVQWILSLWGVSAISSEDIILLDTGIAFVDIPCSGLKSLWTGTLFLLAATWLEGRRMGGRWLLVFVGNIGLLAIANTARILTLVVATYLWQQPAIAEMLHVPLGLMGFIAASLAAWGLLRWVPHHRQGQKTKRSIPEQTVSLKRRLIGSIALTTSLLLLTLIPSPPQISTPIIPLSALQWSPKMQVETLALNPVEQDFFANYPGVVAQKQRVEFSGLSGSLLFVSSPTWQAHHAPELCLAAIGYHIDAMTREQFTPAVLGRWLSLNQGQQAAAYWFQAPDRTSDNFLTRVLGEVLRQDPSWTLVSVVFDQSHQPDDAAVQAFVTTVHDSLDRVLHTPS